MAKSRQSKKPASSKTFEGPQRKNGKAWKKPKALPKKKTDPTPERVVRHEFILEMRQRRKEDNIARRQAEKEAKEALAALEAEEAEKAKRHDPVGVMVRQKRKQEKLPPTPALAI